MPRPRAHDPTQTYKSAPGGVMRLLLVAFGVALLVGMVTGLMWVAWNLIRLHVLR
jgi:hypothetical protein